MIQSARHHIFQSPHKLLAIFLGLLVLATSSSRTFAQTNFGGERAKALKIYTERNYADALKIYLKLLRDSANDAEAAVDLRQSVQCLQQLNRHDELDGVIGEALKLHGGHWEVMEEVAKAYRNIPHYGFVVENQFKRGNQRGGGEYRYSMEQDRTRMLLYYDRAMVLIEAEGTNDQLAQFYFRFAAAMLFNRENQFAWKLSALTDFEILLELSQQYYQSGSHGTPVDAAGGPLLYGEPTAWQDSANDGQRWRWLLAQAVKANPELADQALHQRANFSRSQFGVQLLRNHPTDGEVVKVQEGRFALPTLKDTETITRLATGVQRFELPAEHNHILMFKRLGAQGAVGHGNVARHALAEIYKNRRQFVRAADVYRALLAENPTNRGLQTQLSEITGNWGMFEQSPMQPAGRGAEFDFRFRNAKNVQFEAKEIRVEALLKDTRTYLSSNPAKLDWQKLQVGNIGWQLVQGNYAKYVGRRVAVWDIDLEPLDKHFDKRITINSPLQNGGAYLVTAKVDGGNTCQTVLWVADSVMVRKPLVGKNYYFVADAVTGRPLSGAKIEMFGYRVENKKGKQTVRFSEVAGRTDARGQYLPPVKNENNYQWMVVARGSKGQMAFMGFQSLWTTGQSQSRYAQTKAFGITDRPVYRPGDTVKLKFWLRDARYELGDVSRYANMDASYSISDGQEQVASGNAKTDEYGGFDGEYVLPKNAKLGVYSATVPGRGSVTFRVEEYKKPEYEVKIDGPEKPVELGDVIKAKITAKYYFGSPVTEATVHYKILRTDRHDDWYPYAAWDWCFGRGYWWFGYDYSWYPGWNDWRGCKALVPFWWPQSASPPEVVADVETEIGPDGTIEILIDTALAKELFSDRDHEYQITAEVRDQSRRTIVGQGKVIVSRQPFKVYTWLNRGYYRSGQTVAASVSARNPTGEVVSGKGTARLLEIRYNAAGEPAEREVESWEIETDQDGLAEWKFKAGGTGQYRLSTTVDDGQGHKIEGGYIFTVAGDGFSGREFRYSSLELVPDQREYAPGDRVQLQVNSDHADATVLLFVRPENGQYKEPRIIRLDGKTQIIELGIDKSDMPNFFVEAVTIFGGEVHTVTREIIVPPEKRVLTVAVEPKKDEYLPGEKANVRLHVTDHTGENYRGSLVVAVYDKSVEYISGGSNVVDIREFFWKWRRSHHPYQASNLVHFSQNLTPSGQRGFSFLGVFGHALDQDFKKYEMRQAGGQLDRAKSMRGGFGGAPMALAADSMAAEEGDAESPGGGTGAAAAAPTVRSNFADTALWVGSLNTDEDGYADVGIDMPESLTTWKIRTWAVSHGTRVGQGEAEVITRKNVILRMQTPRFAVEKDEVVLSANVHNYLPEKVSFKVSIVLPDGLLSSSDPISQDVTIDSNGEARLNWRAKVHGEGTAKIQMIASSGVESDAMELSFPCKVHGAERTQSWAGTVARGKQSAQVKIEIPAERRADQSRLIVQYSPSLAVAMVDAIPYLAAYPYGCTEQTLNRFVPAVIAQKTLLDMDLDLAAIREKRTNLNAQEIGDARDRAKQWKRFDRNPVFDENELDDMVRAGITRLTNMQNADGGWGWFGGGSSYPHTTAVVVHGLQVAQSNGGEISPDLIASGVRWLQRFQSAEVVKLQNANGKTEPYKTRASDLDALVFMLLCDAQIHNEAMRDFLYRDRSGLSVYGLTIYALGLETVEEVDKLAMLKRNIEQYLVQDEENETAYLELQNRGYWWNWYGDETETQASYLKLLSRLEPKSAKASRLAKYLVNQRKHSTYWNSTRDTALCIEAFGEYIAASGETRSEMEIDVAFDGVVVKTVEISPESLFSFDNRFELSGVDLKAGEHQVELRRRGEGPVYFNAYLTVFDKRDMIPSAGLEVKVRRNYYRMVPKEASVNFPSAGGQAVAGKLDAYDRVKVEPDTILASGDLLEVELVVTSKNDYEYLLLEDYKPAGFEAVGVRSGYDHQGMTTYREFRDDRVAIFARQIPRGERSIRYQVRAEIPGRFSALPTQITGMYAPELRGNSDENKISIED